MHRWACIIVTQLPSWAQTSDGDLSGGHYQSYLHHRQGFLQDWAYLSIGGRPPPSVPTRHGKEGVCGLGEGSLGSRDTAGGEAKKAR